MTAIRVLWSHGLLDLALLRELDRSKNRLFVSGERFHWIDEAKLGGQFEKTVNEFAATVGKVNRWQIFWELSASGKTLEVFCN